MEKKFLIRWDLIGLWVGILIALPPSILSVWEQFFPTHEKFRETDRVADLRYMSVTSRTGLAPIPLELQIGAHAIRKELPLSLANFVIINPGNESHKDPVQLSVPLYRPILGIGIYPYGIPPEALVSCSGTIFKPKDYLGEKNFCIQINPFPRRATLGVFLLFEGSEPVFGEDEMFIGPLKDPRIAKQIQVDVNKLIVELQQARADLQQKEKYVTIVIPALFGGILILICALTISIRRRTHHG